MEIEAEREKIQREIEELEKSLGPILPTAEIQGSDFSLESGSEEEEDLEEDDFDIDVNMETDPGGKKDATSEEEEEEGEVNLPQTPETCLQMNLVYQEVIQEKIEEVQSLLAQNREQQEKLMWELAGTKGAKAGDGKSLPANMFLGHFMKPYFKDKTSGIGPPANSDAREKARQGIKSFEELLTIKWKSREKLLLRQSVVSDRLHHLLQPKLLKLEYLNEKLEKSKDGMERQIVGKQIRETEEEINVINVLPEEALLGNRLEEHDWDKIANINFEGTRNGKELRKYWQNYEHPSINKKEWEEEEIEKLKEIAASRHFLGWEAIAQELGTQRTAFQCLQKFQSYHKDFKRGEWAPEEDRMLKQLVQEMRIGKHIPYRKIAYYMEGRDPAQLIYRWTKRVDPNLKRGTWTPKEDALLLKAVAKYGERDWYKIRTEVPGRNDIQCRDRYLHSLHYDIKKGRWSEEEEMKLVELTEKYGRGHWAKIASELPHRSGAQCLSKWKVLLGYRRNRRKKQGNKLYPKRKRVHRCSSNSSESSSENSDLEMDGDSTEEEEEPKSCKSKASGHWRVPGIDLWVPARKEQSEPSSGEMAAITLLSKGFDVNRKRQLVPDEHQSTEDFITANSGISESLPMNSRNKDAWRVSLAYVKRVLRSNSYKLQRRNREIRRKKRFDTHAPIVPGDSRLALAAGEAIQGRGQKEGLWRTTIYRRLMMAVTPWAGSRVQAWALRVKKGTFHESKADITFKQLQTAHLKSTPLFTFLIQLLHIDVDGCMKVIRKRKSQQPELLRTFVGTAGKGTASLPSSSQDGKALPGPPVASIQPSKNLIPLRAKEGPVPANTWKARSPPRPASRLKTVSELLREKRLREMKAKKVVPKQILLTPPLLLTPSVVVQQPLAGSPLNPANSQPAPPAASVPLVQTAGQNVASPGEASGDFGEMIFPCAESREASVDMGQGSLLPKGSLGAAGDPTAAPLLPVIDPAQPRPLASLNPARPKDFGAQQNSVHVVPTLVAPQPGIPASLKPTLPITWVLTPQGLIPLTILSLPSQGKLLASGSGASPTPSQPMETLSGTPAPGVVPLAERPQSQEALPSCSARADAAAPRLPLVNSRELGGSPSPASAGTLPLHPTVSSRAEPSSADSEHQTEVSGGCPSLPPLGGCPEPPLLTQQSSSTPPEPQEEPFSPLSRLISLETEAAVKEWARGGSGARVPLLGPGLPYLPPFLCSLKALSVLLSSKKSLERSAAHLVAPPEGQEEPSQPDLEALRQKIRQRLRDNPAYHLLRGRFLAAFTFPAALAALPPSRVTTTLLGGPKGKSSSSEDSCSSEEEEEEEEEAGRETQSRPNGMADAREELEGPGPDSADGSDPTQLRRSSRLRRRRRQL